MCRIVVFLRVLVLAVPVVLVSACDPPFLPPVGRPPSVEFQESPVLESSELLARLPRPEETVLDVGLASKLVALSLECTARPWPYKPGHVLEGPGDLRLPREVTPAFYGCFDWHSAVHGHWAMVRVLRLFPDIDVAPEVRDRLAGHLVPERMEQELAFFSEERNRLFERPYGWAWLLRLHQELRRAETPAAQAQARAVRPLARFLAERLSDYLGNLSAPIRTGTHPNTAFALHHALDWAEATGDESLQERIRERARDFYGGDENCPVAYEPSGEDFVSPCLAEALVMTRVLPIRERVAWLDGFLPAPGAPAFAQLREPPSVRDPEDPRIGHLIGLDFHRAWCFDGIATALPPGDDRVAVYRRLARIHRRAGLDLMFDAGYGGSHWLASFALFALTASD